MKLVSIVIPVYNVEQYLKRCLDSIINQTYQTLEIILINDGSTDNSGSICDAYQKKDSRIVVIHKENGGLSDARNRGIDIATGEYITFVDSDDFVSLDYVEVLVQLLEKCNADTAVCMFQKFEKENEINPKDTSKKELIFTGYDAVKDLCYQKHIPNSAWAKLYKTSLFAGIRYPVGRLYEDLGTTYRLLLRSKKVIYNTSVKYYYFQRRDSIMHYSFSTKNMDRVLMSEQLFGDIKDISTELKKAAMCRMFLSNVQVLRELPLDNDDFSKEREMIVTNIKQQRNTVLFDHNAKLMIRIIALSTYLPIQKVQKLGKIYKKFQKN